MKAGRGPGLEIYPYSYVIQRPDPAADYFEAYKNIGRKYSRISGSDLFATVAQAAIDNGKGEIFCKKADYPIGALVTVKDGRVLMFEPGSVITPAADVDMLKPLQNGRVIGGHYDTTGIAFTKSVFKLGEGVDYAHQAAHETLISRVTGKGGTTGNFLYLHALENDGLTFTHHKGWYVEGFDKVIYIHVDHSAGYAFINGNHFSDIFGYNCKYLIYEEKNWALPLSDLANNKFSQIDMQKGPNLVTGVVLDGESDKIKQLTLWDLEGSLGLQFNKNTRGNRVEVLSGMAFRDYGINNDVIYAMQYPYAVVDFCDQFLGASLRPCWNVISGTVAHQASYGGACKFTTGAVTGNTARAWWNGNSPLNSYNGFLFAARFKNLVRATNYLVKIGVRANSDDDYIYLAFGTDLAQGGAFGSYKGGVGAQTDFSYSHTTEGATLWINVYSDKIVFSVNEKYIGEVTNTDHIPTATLQPYIHFETREDSQFYGQLDYVFFRQQKVGA